MKSAHNMKFHFEPEHLHEVADDEAAMKQGIAEMLQQLATVSNEAEKAQQLVRIGAYQRVVKQYAESELSLRDAIAIFQKHHSNKPLWAAQLRLAVTLQAQDKFKDAQDIYMNYLKQLSTPAKAEIESLEEYAYFHWGLLRYNSKQYKMAIDYLIKSLEFKLARGEMESIQQTQMVIDMARSKLDKSA